MCIRSRTHSRLVNVSREGPLTVEAAIRAPVFPVIKPTTSRSTMTAAKNPRWSPILAAHGSEFAGMQPAVPTFQPWNLASARPPARSGSLRNLRSGCRRLPIDQPGAESQRRPPRDLWWEPRQAQNTFHVNNKSHPRGIRQAADIAHGPAGSTGRRAPGKYTSVGLSFQITRRAQKNSEVLTLKTRRLATLPRWGSPRSLSPSVDWWATSYRAGARRRELIRGSLLRSTVHADQWQVGTGRVSRCLIGAGL